MLQIDINILFSNNIVIAALVVYSLLLYVAFLWYYSEDDYKQFAEVYAITTSCLIVFFIALVVFYMVFVVWGSE